MLWVVPSEKGTLTSNHDYVLTNPLYPVKQWARDTVASDSWALWRKN